MIEYCTKKIMVFTVSGVILLSVLILFFEDSFVSSSAKNRHNWLSAVSINNSTYLLLHMCLSSHRYEIMKQCRACPTFEVKAAIPHCTATGYKQQVLCKLPTTSANEPPKVKVAEEHQSKVLSTKKPLTITNPAERSLWMPCLGDPNEQFRHYLMFEGISILTAMGAYAAVYRRQRRLDILLMEKVNKQIGAGV